MPGLARKPAVQYGLTVALLVALACGVLAPVGAARATGAGGANGTPVASAPTPPQAATPTIAARPGPPATPAATQAASPATAVLVTPQAATPTRLPSGTVSAAISRDLSPLALTLNGRDQVVQTTLAIDVTDTAPTVRQPGWSLALTLEQFRIADNPARTLPAEAVTLLGVTVACAGAIACTAPENSIAYPRAMPAGAAVEILNAAPGSGGGRLVVTMVFTVRVPATAYAGNYHTTIVADIASDRHASPAAVIAPITPLWPIAASATPPPTLLPLTAIAIAAPRVPRRNQAMLY